MKTLILTLSLLIAAVLCSCQKQNKIGEAFVVLKSGEVIYMADMQVLCLGSDFQKHFDTLKKDWERDSQNSMTAIEAKNPALQSKLKDIDASIAALKSKATSVAQDTQATTSDLLRRLDSERDALSAELAKTSKASSEYNQITQPINQKINELEAEADKIRSDQKTLISETLAKLNQYIVEAQLKVPKLEEAIGLNLFATTPEKSYGFEGNSRPTPRVFGGKASKPFLVERPKSEGYWWFLINVPDELEGTPMDAVIKAAYQKWNTLESSRENVVRQADNEKTSRNEGLIPWENRYGISRLQGFEFVNKQEKLNNDLKQFDEQLNILKTGGAEASELVLVEIRKKVSEIDESVASLKEQRLKAVKEAFESADIKSKIQFRSKLYELLKNSTITDVRTGSKGDFNVPGNTAYVYAEMQRDNGEKIVWLVRIDPSMPKIKLSVSNTASAGGEGQFDEFWMLKWNLD
jgi:hypothetical protein